MPPHAEPAPAAGATYREPEDLELLHVFVLFRHGDRTPITRVVSAGMSMDQAETSFWISRMPELSVLSALNSGSQVADFDEDYLTRGAAKKNGLTPPKEAHHGGRWPCGQLTDKGVHMMRAKGRALRERYAGFLADVHPTRDVYVQSTNIRRTIRSAQSVLAGMFPEHFTGFDDQNVGGNHDARKGTSEDQSFVVFADDSNALAPQHSYELYRDLGELLAYEMKHNAPIDVAATAKRIREIVGARPDDKRVAWTGCACSFVVLCGLPLAYVLTGVCRWQCARCSSAGARMDCRCPRGSRTSCSARSATLTRGCGSRCTASASSAPRASARACGASTRTCEP